MIATDGDHEWMDLFQARLGTNALGAAEQEAVERAYVGIRSYQRGENIVDDGKERESLHLVTDGWAARVVMLEDASRQITDFVLPGELCDLWRLDDGVSATVVAVTPLRVALLDRAAMLEAIEHYPKLGLAYLRLTLHEQEILREWLVCLGRRQKREHLAHLLCELHQRLRRVGLVADHEFDLPLTQEQIADATGMSAVHANRVLQRLRREGVISLGQQHLRIHRPQQLADIGKFDHSYLVT
jgi:CRP-like cAMP-binding protein